MLHCNIMTINPTRSAFRNARRTLAIARPLSTEAMAGIRGAAIAEAESMSELCLRLMQDRWTAAAVGFEAFARCRTPQDFLAAHAALVCEDLDLIRGGCERLSEIIAQAAGDTVRSLPEQAAECPAPLA
jgi:hypothetical protein